MEIVGSALVYLGLATALAGVMNAIRPLRRLGVQRRRTGFALLGGGLLLVVLGLALPVREARATVAASHLDHFVPSWEFQELHTTRVHATPERVDRAVRAVTADEIWLFRTLTWIRHPGRPWVPRAESILAPPEQQPILDVALRTTFLSLADEPGREVVVGTIVCCKGARVRDPDDFVRLEEPGFAKAGMNFLMSDEGNGWTKLSTETRVHGTDPVARRRFATYWRVIYPGSALIRVMWLRAIKARAEKEGA